MAEEVGFRLTCHPKDTHRKSQIITNSLFLNGILSLTFRFKLNTGLHLWSIAWSIR